MDKADDDPGVAQPLPPDWFILQVPNRPDVTIRPGLAGDEEGVAGLYVDGERVAYGSFAPPQYLEALNVELEIPLWRKEIDSAKSFLYVAVAANELVGFANGGLSEGPTAALSDTWVRGDWHHAGVAQALASATVDRCREAGAKKLGAMVHPQNKAGEGFCKKLGAVYKGYVPRALWFRATDNLPDYYGILGVWEWADISTFGHGPAKAP